MEKMIEVPFSLVKMVAKSDRRMRQYLKRNLNQSDEISVEESVNAEDIDYKSMKYADLVKLASDVGIKDAGKKKKKELVELLESGNADNNDK